MPPKRDRSSIEEAKGSPVRSAGSETAPARESPLKRLKAAMQERAVARVLRQEVVLSTVDEFRAHAKREALEGLEPDTVVIVRGTLLWKSEHVYGERTLVRLHLTDASPAESLDELTEFEDQHRASEEGRVTVDSLLLTVTIFGETMASQHLPPNGQIIRIVNSRKRAVYENQFCQLVARVTDIRLE